MIDCAKLYQTNPRGGFSTVQDPFANDKFHLVKTEDKGFYFLDICFYFLDIDILISGINRGANLGTNIIYSGTVSAATEGTIMGIPSIAISLASYKTDKYEVVKTIAKKIVEYVMKNSLPKATLLNVNVPYCNIDDIKGMKITKQGSQYFVDEFEERIDPRNRNYYWIKGKMIDDDRSLDFDGKAIKENYVSITPIHFNLTNEPFLDALRKDFFHE